MPLTDIDQTFRRLILVELLVTGGLLVLLGATAGLVIRRELRPLESMARAADDIAQGDLQRRVDESDPRTEIGRLGVAFNDMLDGISTLLDERRRSEHRLRQFVADASHELRTPVAAVRGYTDLYARGRFAGRRRGRARDAADGLRVPADGRAGRGPADADPGRRRADHDARCGRPLRAADRRGRRRRRHRPAADLAAGRRLRTGLRARRPAASAPAVRQSAGQRAHPYATGNDGHRLGAARTPGNCGHRQRQRAGGVRRGPAATVRQVLPGGRVAQPGERRHRSRVVHRGRDRPLARRCRSTPPTPPAAG